MSTINIDLNDSPEMLGKIGNFLLSLTGNVELPVTVTPADTDDVPSSMVTSAMSHPHQGAYQDNAPATVAPIPVATTPATVATLAAGEGVDSSGLPWDERIHAGTKTKNKDGTWKLRKGVDKALVEQIRSELVTPVIPPIGSGQPMQPSPASQAAAAAGQPTMTPPMFPQATTMSDQTGAITMPGATVNTVPDQGAVTASMPGQPTAGTTWMTVLNRVVAAQQGGRNLDADIEQFMAAHGMSGGLPIMVTRPDLFDSFLQALQV